MYSFILVLMAHPEEQNFEIYQYLMSDQGGMYWKCPVAGLSEARQRFENRLRQTTTKSMVRMRFHDNAVNEH